MRIISLVIVCFFMVGVVLSSDAFSPNASKEQQAEYDKLPADAKIKLKNAQKEFEKMSPAEKKKLEKQAKQFIEQTNKKDDSKLTSEELKRCKKMKEKMMVMILKNYAKSGDKKSEDNMLAHFSKMSCSMILKIEKMASDMEKEKKGLKKKGTKRIR